MGIEAIDARLVASAVAAGLKLDSACTLGRQNLFCSFEELRSIVKESGLAPADVTETPSVKGQRFADDLFRLLGVKEICSMDVSDYEDASIVHDLNAPIPPELDQRFDLVYDGGTLEHVFNYPVGLKNAMRMVKEGGALMIATPANSLCGHGFYQLSPELFFRALSPENGYRIKRIFMPRDGRLYQVRDPIEVHGRVMLMDGAPTFLYVHAERIDASVEIFARPPQQSDYATAWTEAEEKKESEPGANDSPVKAFLRRKMNGEQIEAVSRFLQPFRQRRAVKKAHSDAKLDNRNFYTPVNITEGLAEKE
ncbi:hypothetical protein [Hyphococcus sp.]|uniref:hypothetical protein n=1 Tax=Hyphococcus sp. TaxID=2038636 RepID=UPI003D0F5F45